LTFIAQALELLQICSGQLLAFGDAQIEKIYFGAAVQKLEVQMRPGRVPGLPDVSDNFTGLDRLTFAEPARKF
jgi:hypothetical protein